MGSNTIQEEDHLTAPPIPRLSDEEVTELYDQAKKNLALSKVPDIKDRSVYGLQVKGYRWLYRNKIRKNRFLGRMFRGSSGELFSGEDGGGYRYLIPSTAEDRASISRALELTRRDFVTITGKEAPLTPPETSYEIQYHSLQLEVVKMMVWEQGRIRIPKLVCVGPFEIGFEDWTPPDPSLRVIEAETI
ncbi:hypothetical protein G7Y79_00021g049840 [Physcia stellaris]|nr:hypothetical protein G7Y79_00021g049840 [Physcia stellaris]